jgi:hypothetical protein
MQPFCHPQMGASTCRSPPELRGAGKLRVVAWLEPEAEKPAKTGAGAWALQARGIVRLSPGESPDDARMASLRPKFVDL